jgi:membrane protein DedA with SNARE-associated domain
MPVPVFESIVDALSGSSWSYLIVFAVATLDAFFPIVPSETVAITAGVLAGAGDLNALVAVVAAASGAFVGDNISYGLGHFFGERTVNRFFSGEKAKRRIAWAENQLEVRGSYIITVARFIPGGRTATTFTAGYVEFPWRKFLLFDAIAASIWGSYTVMLGYFGGSQFEEEPWKGLLLAFAIALAVTGLIEAVRFLRHRRQAA